MRRPVLLRGATIRIEGERDFDRAICRPVDLK
jgi:hypothetical protein